MPSKRSLALALYASVGLLSTAATSNLRAVVYNETGDAGQTLGTAQVTAGDPLTGITGTLSTFTDVDLFRIYISNPATFSATTVGGTNLDTALFLFTLSGTAILANDDGSGTSLGSTLPAGNSALTSLTPGFYYLGIALSGNEPVNSVNQFLFAQSSTSTDLRGPASGVNPATLFNWNGNTSFNESGAYTITLTGANSIPEPSVLALAGVGTALLGARFMRRNRAARR